MPLFFFLCAFLSLTSTLAVCKYSSAGAAQIFPPTLSPSGALVLRLCFGNILNYRGMEFASFYFSLLKNKRVYVTMNS